MKFHMQSDSTVTLIENFFIDQYMPAANGEFVKLYLYLLRCAGSGMDISISSIADVFDHTEKDVRRALSYWEKLDLLRLGFDTANNITDITFLRGNAKTDAVSASDPDTDRSVPAPASAAASAVSSDASSSGPSETAAMPGRRDISPARRKELRSQEEIRQIIFIGSQYLARPMTTTEINTILYFYDCLHFSQDLIIYLLEYCADKGNPGLRYMERVAQEWFKNGITTVDQAKLSSNAFQKDYYRIFHALGLGDRNITPAEKEYIDRWKNEYHFDIELIEEACARTILQTHEPSFPYTESILSGWFQNHVKTKEDVARLDQEHAAKATAVKSAKTPSGRSASRSTSGRTSRINADNRFTRISQRDYDWQNLEKELLQSQTTKTE